MSRLIENYDLFRAKNKSLTSGDGCISLSLSLSLSHLLTCEKYFYYFFLSLNVSNSNSDSGAPCQELGAFLKVGAFCLKFGHFFNRHLRSWALFYSTFFSQVKMWKYQLPLKFLPLPFISLQNNNNLLMGGGGFYFPSHNRSMIIIAG